MEINVNGTRKLYKLRFISIEMLDSHLLSM